MYKKLLLIGIFLFPSICFSMVEEKSNGTISDFTQYGDSYFDNIVNPSSYFNKIANPGSFVKKLKNEGIFETFRDFMTVLISSLGLQVSPPVVMPSFLGIIQPDEYHVIDIFPYNKTEDKAIFLVNLVTMISPSPNKASPYLGIFAKKHNGISVDNFLNDKIITAKEAQFFVQFIISRIVTSYFLLNQEEKSSFRTRIKDEKMYYTHSLIFRGLVDTYLAFSKNLRGKDLSDEDLGEMSETLEFIDSLINHKRFLQDENVNKVQKKYIQNMFKFFDKKKILNDTYENNLKKILLPYLKKLEKPEKLKKTAPSWFNRHKNKLKWGLGIGIPVVLVSLFLLHKKGLLKNIKLRK